MKPKWLDTLAAFLNELGIEDFTDKSDFEKSDDSESKSTKDQVNSQPNTPRGILKKVWQIQLSSTLG